MWSKLTYVKTNKGYISDIKFDTKEVIFCEKRKDALLFEPMKKLNIKEIFDICLNATCKEFAIVESKHWFDENNKVIIGN